jgi:Flp pilus assembly protein TadD
VPEPPPTTGTGTTGTTTGSAGTGTGTGSNTAQPDEEKVAQAEALNEQGKDKLRSADMAGALADFQRANQVAPDARYQYNVCLAYEALEQWQNAVAACKQARGMTTDERLVAKVDHRLDLLAAHH